MKKILFIIGSLRAKSFNRQVANAANPIQKGLKPLLTFYNRTIDMLKCAEDIRRLRQQYYEATGMMAHEPEPSNAVVVTASGFWSKLNKILIN